ncbi:uncharacterized protein LOC101222359 [Cucumis sativus]|uniref:Uncharacterized protein n=1 Tax=Cucumis sativus TaxID=3659 RepID=A0A0A0KTE2_CUCSA|nr:uncharacterized protein LOC101222359 [Cucumis sativus]
MDEDGVSEKWYQGLRRYWKRKNYKKLNGSSRRRRRLAQVELGSTRNTRRRFWRIKISPKFRFLRKIPSPKKLLLRLRDAYVNMMLGFANSRVFNTSYGGGAAVCDGIPGFGQRLAKEYDEKMILEIYKSVVAEQREMIHRPVAAGSAPETAQFR